MAQSTSFVNPMASYSPFFSSGFLAPHSAHPQLYLSTSDSENSSCPPSPSCTSSPMREDSTMDVELAELLREVTPGSRRSVTPTPGNRDHSTPVASPQAARLFSSTGSQPTPSQPRLRKRRSSLTLGSSPMNSIRSPARSAGNALHMQMQLPPTRSRSGSVGTDIATEEKSLVGRMRSGSCSSVGPGMVVSTPPPIAPSKYVRPRRLGRRVYTAPIPAPLAPPPTTPLPSPPSQQSSLPSTRFPKLRPADINLEAANPVSAAMKSPAPTSARARGLSVSSSALDGVENRIDEDMKEN